MKLNIIEVEMNRMHTHHDIHNMRKTQSLFKVLLATYTYKSNASTISIPFKAHPTVGV